MSTRSKSRDEESQPLVAAVAPRKATKPLKNSCHDESGSDLPFTLALLLVALILFAFAIVVSALGNRSAVMYGADAFNDACGARNVIPGKKGKMNTTILDYRNRTYVFYIPATIAANHEERWKFCVSSCPPELNTVDDIKAYEDDTGTDLCGIGGASPDGVGSDRGICPTLPIPAMTPFLGWCIPLENDTLYSEYISMVNLVPIVRMELRALYASYASTLMFWVLGVAVFILVIAVTVPRQSSRTIHNLSVITANALSPTVCIIFGMLLVFTLIYVDAISWKLRLDTANVIILALLMKVSLAIWLVTMMVTCATYHRRYWLREMIDIALYGSPVRRSRVFGYTFLCVSLIIGIYAFLFNSAYSAASLEMLSAQQTARVTVSHFAPFLLVFLTFSLFWLPDVVTHAHFICVSTSITQIVYKDYEEDEICSPCSTTLLQNLGSAVVGSVLMTSRLMRTFLRAINAICGKSVCGAPFEVAAYALVTSRGLSFMDANRRLRELLGKSALVDIGDGTASIPRITRKRNRVKTKKRRTITRRMEELAPRNTSGRDAKRASLTASINEANAIAMKEDGSLSGISAKEKAIRTRLAELKAINALVEAQAAKLKAKREELQTIVGTLLPEVENAKSTIQTMDKGVLFEMKKMSRPPDAVKTTMEALALILGHNDLEWKSLTLFITKDTFIPSIKNFDVDSLKKKNVDILVEKYMKNPDFNYQKVVRASSACGPLYKWIEALLKYMEVMRNFGPLKEEIATAEAEWEALEAKRANMSGQIAKMTAELTALQLQTKMSMRRKEKARLDVESLEKKLSDNPDKAEDDEPQMVMVDKEVETDVETETDEEVEVTEVETEEAASANKKVKLNGETIAMYLEAVTFLVWLFKVAIFALILLVITTVIYMTAPDDARIVAGPLAVAFLIAYQMSDCVAMSLEAVLTTLVVLFWHDATNESLAVSAFPAHLKISLAQLLHEAADHA